MGVKSTLTFSSTVTIESRVLLERLTVPWPFRILYGTRSVITIFLTT
jgi:hypothetical protein